MPVTRKVRASRLHMGLAALWALLTVPTLLWWSESVLWVSLMSLYAIVVSHLAASLAARAKEKVRE